jgi:hypothetical protein
VSEAQAEAVLADLLSADGWQVSRQVPLGAKRVDIVATRRNKTMSIELKLRDWRRAISQAYLNAAYFDATFVALPRNPRRRLNGSLFRELHIRLIEFDTDGWNEVVIPFAGPHGVL